MAERFINYRCSCGSDLSVLVQDNGTVQVMTHGKPLQWINPTSSSEEELCTCCEPPSFKSIHTPILERKTQS